MRLHNPVLDLRASTLARNTILNFVGQALPLLVGFLTIPITIRWLGADRFGIISIVWVIVGYFGFFDLGLGRATTKFVAEAFGKGEFEKVPRYFWTTVGFQGILGFTGAVVLALLTPLLVNRVLNIPFPLIGESRSTFYILAISFPIVMVSGSFRGLLEASQRFDLVNFVKIPSSIFNYLAPLAGILMGYGLPGIMVILAASRALTLLAWFLMCRRVFPILKSGFAIHKETIKPLLSFGGWVTVSNIVGPFLVSLDRFLIGSILSIGVLSYYSAPYELIMRLWIIPASLIVTLFPAFSALDIKNDSEKIKVLFGRSVKYMLLFLGMIVVLIIFFAQKFLRVWLGEDFAQNSGLVFQILAVGFLVNALANIPYSFLLGRGRADLTAKFHLAELVFYAPLAWGLIKAWGIRGAAAAWTIRVVVDMILLFWAAWKIGKINVCTLSKNGAVRVGIALSIYGLAGYFIMQLAWGVYGVFPLTVGLAVALWFYAFSKEERIWVWNRSKEVLRKPSVQ